MMINDQCIEALILNSSNSGSTDKPRNKSLKQSQAKWWLKSRKVFQTFSFTLSHSTLEPWEIEEQITDVDQTKYIKTRFSCKKYRFSKLEDGISDFRQGWSSKSPIFRKRKCDVISFHFCRNSNIIRPSVPHLVFDASNTTFQLENMNSKRVWKVSNSV